MLTSSSRCAWQLAAGAALWLCTTAAHSQAAAQAQAAVYLLDPHHSFVHFEVLHFGTSTSRGRFGPVAGSVVLNRTAGSGEVDIRVSTASVDTGIPVFNARLRQEDLLASTEHPEAFFVARTVRFDGDRVAEVRGEFTLRGVSQPLSLFARQFGCRQDGPDEVCGGDFEGEVLRSSFGATFGLPLISDRVRLVVQVEGRLVR
ncbi:MAG: YceI family protein [Rubrivivax sp.]|nr:YceI family protein [Rubrivivax sp.]MDP3223786.1 YceI family protein [Rubrivivax sp.]MDP3612479.1 YceI family protein [Rubrivivax sp.]